MSSAASPLSLLTNSSLPRSNASLILFSPGQEGPETSRGFVLSGLS
jgi:hypothetical protein